MRHDSVLTVVVVSDLDEFRALEAEWDLLVRAMPRPSPFLLHAWVARWWKHFGTGAILAVVTARRDGILVGALPLMIRSWAGIRVIEFVGGRETKLGDLLVTDPQDRVVAEALLAAMRSLPYDFADLRAMPERSRFEAALEPRQLRNVDEVAAPIVDLSRGWEATYRDKTSSKTRNTHKRRLRQLGELGELEFSVAKSSDELKLALERAFTVHEKGWAHRRDLSYFGHEAGRNFHREVVPALGGIGVARIITLTIDGEPVAFDYYLLLCGRLYLHRLAFDPAFGKFSPGMATTLRMLSEGYEEGARFVEFMAGDAEYKRLLSDRSDPLCRAVGLARTVRGRVGVAAASGAVGMRRALRSSESLRRAYRTRRALDSSAVRQAVGH